MTATSLDRTIGRRLRHRRHIVGMTIAQVADVVGVRFQQIAKYECGATSLSVARFMKVCEALHTPPAEILSDLVQL